MRVFLDFEASSLEKHGYPIEVAWVFEDGRSESHLIRPALQWTDWDDEAEALHGISRSKLESEGEPAEAVARRLLETLAEHEVYASAPSWDGKWLSALLRAAGLPRHAMRLKDTDKAQAETARDTLRLRVPVEQLDDIVMRVLERVHAKAAEQQVKHRALEDAEQERQLWLDVPAIAAEEAKALAATRPAT